MAAIFLNESIHRSFFIVHGPRSLNTQLVLASNEQMGTKYNL